MTLGDHIRNGSLARDASGRLRVRHVCRVCGEPFYPPRTDAKYCSSPCRQKAYRKRKRLESYG